MKRLNRSISDCSEVPTGNIRSFENEIRMLTEMRHRNVIKLNGFCWKGECMYLVYEFIERGSLAKVLRGEDMISLLHRASRRCNCEQKLTSSTSNLENITTNYKNEYRTEIILVALGNFEFYYPFVCRYYIIMF